MSQGHPALRHGIKAGEHRRPHQVHFFPSGPSDPHSRNDKAWRDRPTLAQTMEAGTVVPALGRALLKGGSSMDLLVSFFLFVCLFCFNLFIFGCVGSSLLNAGFSLVATSGGYSSLRCVGLSLWWLLLLRSTGSRYAGFSSCGSRALERRLSNCGSRA